MTYTKPWNNLNPSGCEWHSWLAINAVNQLEYQLHYFQDRIELEFLDLDRAAEFAAEFGL